MRLLFLLLISACHGERATAETCTHILDRIVALELHERGYRDPHLLQTHTEEMRAKFKDKLQGCVGRPISPNASRCLDAARTTEELVHTCLH